MTMEETKMQQRERVVANVIETADEVLQRNDVGAASDFFDLRGHVDGCDADRVAAQ